MFRWRRDWGLYVLENEYQALDIPRQAADWIGGLTCRARHWRGFDLPPLWLEMGGAFAWNCTVSTLPFTGADSRLLSGALSNINFCLGIACIDAVHLSLTYSCL